MILQIHNVKLTDGSGGDMTIWEDNIREIANHEEGDVITYIMKDGRENVVRKDDPSHSAIYLLNDEGKTLARLK